MSKKVFIVPSRPLDGSHGFLKQGVPVQVSGDYAKKLVKRGRAKQVSAEEAEEIAAKSATSEPKASKAAQKPSNKSARKPANKSAPAAKDQASSEGATDSPAAAGGAADTDAS